MVVVGPAEPESVLSRLLHLSGPIFRLPVSPLGCEEQIARPVRAQIGDRYVDQLLDVVEADVVDIPVSCPSLK